MSSLCPVFIFAPGPMAGAEQVVLTGLRALNDLKDSCTPQLIIIKETRAPHCADQFLAAVAPLKIKVSVLETTRAFDPRLCSKLQRSIAKIESEGERVVLHTHAHKALFYTLCCLRRSPLIHTHHGDTAVDKKVSFYESLVKYGMNFCDRVIAVSKAMEESLGSELVVKDRIRLVENPISLPLSEATAPQHQTGKTIKLLYAGRLSPEKGIVEFLAEFLAPHTPQNLHLTILGDGVLRSEVERLLKERASERVSYLGHQPQVAQFLKSHDALVLPSFREGLPMILLESTALALPIIGSRVGGIPALVANQENGLLFNPHSPSEVTQALAQFPQQIAPLKAQALARRGEIWRRFGPTNWANSTLAIYQELS